MKLLSLYHLTFLSLSTLGHWLAVRFLAWLSDLLRGISAVSPACLNPTGHSNPSDICLLAGLGESCWASLTGIKIPLLSRSQEPIRFISFTIPNVVFEQKTQCLGALYCTRVFPPRYSKSSQFFSSLHSLLGSFLSPWQCTLSRGTVFTDMPVDFPLSSILFIHHLPY